MRNFNIHEADAQLTELIDRALNGEEVIISKAGLPIVKLVPIVTEEKNRQGGQWKGRIKITDDFDDLPDDFEAAFGSDPA